MAFAFGSQVNRIISGGQTGVDRAALDWAIGHGIDHGGWCPKGRKAEDGAIPVEYRLTEMESAAYRSRTRQNVIDSDGTLILNIGELSEGTLETHRIALQLGRPRLVVQLDDPNIAAEAQMCLDWVLRAGLRVLNVAGPRESKRPGVYAKAREFLDMALRASS